jgi:Tfp pilus assembly protein PilO
MDKVKQWVALTAVGALLVAVAGWFLLISPKHSEASSVRGQVTSAEQANQMLTTQLAQLKAQQKDLPKQQAKLAAVAARVPDNPALPALIRAVNKAATDAGVELVSLSPVAPAPFVPAVAAATAVTASGATAAAPAATALQSITVSLNVVGPYFQVEQFLDRLEGLTRAFKVSGFSLTPGDNPVKPATTSTGPAVADTGKSLTAAITGQVFMSPAIAATAPVK